ncbi:MAG TPA: cupin domain-containing protein [Caulobacterales bacterium]|nr:cupin domain-containing protein [Caulobacterales bacterium]
MDKINLAEKFSLFSEQWRPKIVGELNGQEVKLVKVRGVFPWHCHAGEDEMFLVWRGRFRVEYRDRVVELSPGEFTIVPRGVEHRTAADEEAEVLIFEPAAVVNTGDMRDDTYTAPNGVRI